MEICKLNLILKSSKVLIIKQAVSTKEVTAYLKNVRYLFHFLHILVHILASQNTISLVISTLFIKWLYVCYRLIALAYNKKLPFSFSQKGEVYWLLRLRSQLFIQTKDELFASLAFALARSRHTQYGLLLAYDSLRLLCKLTCRREASLWGTTARL